MDVSSDGAVLRLAAVEPGDAGRYECSLTVAGTRQAVEQSVAVTTASAAPAPARLEVEEGDQLSLSCTATPGAAVQWRRGEQVGGRDCNWRKYY